MPEWTAFCSAVDVIVGRTGEITRFILCRVYVLFCHCICKLLTAIYVLTTYWRGGM